MHETKNDRKIRKSRKSSERKTSIKKKWEKFVQQSDFRDLLKNAWKTTNTQKEYSEKLNKLHKKYSV